MKIKLHSNIAFTFATSEVNVLSQQFIKIIELLTGKLKLKKMYDEYVLEDNPPENFWIDAVKKLNFKLQTNYQDGSCIPAKGRLIIVANHAFGVVDGVSICSLISKTIVSQPSTPVHDHHLPDSGARLHTWSLRRRPRE